MFEDIKGVTRGRNMKDRQYNGYKKKGHEDEKWCPSVIVIDFIFQLITIKYSL